MFDKPIDYSKLHKDIRNTYKRQLAIKKEYPNRYQYPPFEMWRTKRVSYKALIEEQKPWAQARAEFNRLSRRMTMLCCIINHAKGKLHMSYWNEAPFTMEKQLHFVRNEWEKYIKEEEQTEAA